MCACVTASCVPVCACVCVFACVRVSEWPQTNHIQRDLSHCRIVTESPTTKRASSLLPQIFTLLTTYTSLTPTIQQSREECGKHQVLHLRRGLPMCNQSYVPLVVLFFPSCSLFLTLPETLPPHHTSRSSRALFMRPLAQSAALVFCPSQRFLLPRTCLSLSSARHISSVGTPFGVDMVIAAAPCAQHLRATPTSRDRSKRPNRRVH